MPATRSVPLPMMREYLNTSCSRIPVYSDVLFLALGFTSVCSYIMKLKWPDAGEILRTASRLHAYAYFW